MIRVRPPALLLLPIVLAFPLFASPAPPTGTWYAALVPTEGHEVSFELRLDRRNESLSATLVNGSVETPFTTASWIGGTLTLEMAHLDGRLTARLDRERLVGSYMRIGASGAVEIPFVASRRTAATPVPPK